MYSFLKRTFDIIVSFTVLFVLSPLLLILTIAVAIVNGRPVFFLQPRPGKHGKIFMLYKFRSMTDKRNSNGDLLPDSQRITKLGKFMRATSLDELPQFFNVLKGDMSFVGPRPKLVKDVIFYPDYVKSLEVTPGITGLAFVNGRNNNTWESLFVYDSIYVKKKSLALDVKIMLKTVGVVFKKTGNNDGTQDVVDYYYPDYLLRVGRISREEYNQGIAKAKRIEKEFKASKDFRKKFALLKSYNKVEDFDFEEKTVE